MEDADFSGYATKAGLKCTDGRTIMPNAFEHQDKMTVPLVWSHSHDGPENVLGHAVLENRPDGVFCHGYFNETEQGKTAKALVQHGDVTWLSIYANQLVEKAKQVFHGAIREVSLVIAGANPGAKIEQVRIAHSLDPDDITVLEDEAVITTGIALEHSAVVDEERQQIDNEVVEHAADTKTETTDEEQTLEDIYNSFTPKQKEVVHFMVGAAIEQASENDQTAEHSDTQTADSVEDDEKTVEHSSTDTNEDTLTHQEGNTDMSRRVFDQNATKSEGPTLAHADVEKIFAQAQKIGSFKEAFLAHAAEQDYGIQDIDILFPDAKAVTDRPDLISRRTEWVAGVLDGAKHQPFSRIKSIAADLTADEARARGYVKGSLKKDEIIKLLKRVTIPTMIYKKQKLDREDIIDITDFDVVVWLKWEMRFMLEEEIARAILIGDGREPDDDDKINEDMLRPIAYDDDMYTHKVTLPTNVSPEGVVESVIRARKNYKGTGRPTFYTTDDILTDMLLIKDKMGRYVYDDEDVLAKKLRVKEIVVVEVMETVPDILGIIVNIADYTIGADRGGQISMFDDFDIDYNQEKYLIETRISGALTKPKSAVVVQRTSGTTVSPQVPAFDEETNTITIPNQTGVSYYVDDEEVAAGALVITQTTDVEARPDAGYNFPHNTDSDWTYAYTA